MRPYSLDLRQRILDAYDAGEGSVRELAERFAVAPNTVQNYLNRRREAGQVAPKAPTRHGPAPALSAGHEHALRALVAEKNDCTDAEYARRLAARTGKRVSRRTVNRAWRRMGYTRKNKALHASEQDRPDVRRARGTYVRWARTNRGRRSVFVDEFGFDQGMTPRTALAPRGERALGKAPVNADPRVTLVMGLDRRGVVAPFAFAGAMDGNVWEQYVARQLGPRLRPGDVVLADGLGAHRSHAARRTVVSRRHARYRLLPPYSPDLTPVEEAGAKIKGHVRRAEPRNQAATYEALGAAIGHVTASDARGWFAHRASYLERRTKTT